MFRLSLNPSYKLLALACAALIMPSALSFALPSSATGDDESVDGSSMVTLTKIGMELDWTRLLPTSERRDSLGSLERAIEELLDAGVPSEQRTAAYYLSAEIHYALKDFREALELFKKAENEDDKGPFADDAGFLRIVSMEADGRDNDAAKEWDRWIKRYRKSPLLSEVLLAKSWNAIRRDTLREASIVLADLEARFPFMREDQRVLLAKSTIAYLNGLPSEADSILGSESNTAAAFYLRALCFETRGEMLEAASLYQRVYERFPESTLRDYAMLAKANIFLISKAYKSAVEEFARVIDSATNEDVRAEAELRRATCMFLDGDAESGTAFLREVTERYRGKSYAARAQLLLGEVLVFRSMHEEAILEFNRVLTDYFEHELAASAQYRVGRCLDELGRHNEATSAYQLVVSGYPLAPQAPAAAYLAGAGLLEQARPKAAIPYFQLVLDRYAQDQGDSTIVFASLEHQELVEASLCLLELSYHKLGNMGQLSGVPHLMLLKMPPSNSQWRAYSLLIDADALAAQARFDEAQDVLETLIDEFPEHEIGISANRLLAWTYAQQGRDDMAIQIEERMLARYASHGSTEHLSTAYLHKAHILFNKKAYEDAAATYDDFIRRYPSHPDHLLALYQSGLCYYRLEQNGDAVDRWERVVAVDPSAEIAERAWVRAGDLYFHAEYYDDAKRCYQGLLDNFSGSRAAALGVLRLAQCEFNAGRDREALELYSEVANRFPGTGVAREAERGMEMSLYRLGQQEDGSKVLGELVEKYPKSAFAADAQFEIAMRHYQADEFLEAAEEFRRVVSQFPSYSAADRAHFLMAESYNKGNSIDDAKVAYEQFLIFFPKSELRSTVHFRLGSIRFGDGEYMGAAIDFTAVIDEGGSDEMALASLFNLALCKKLLGEIDEAQAALEKYREQHPEDDKRAAEVAYQLGDLHETAGRMDMAVKEYKLALSSKPSSDLKIELYYRLGVCYEQLEDINSAINAYNKAMASKNKEDAFRLSAVARCAALYEKKEDYKKAILAYKDLVRNAKDPELVVAAQERVSQLEAFAK
ncbi:MAG: tetratricopeptide repeat protein [Candidatus Latescibacteria bacterium]|nr:tetratricopeptide repeat protein [Candidatus Latescibacterota bacterium]NIO56187.1 tetratricopeptide repeat protein [Candidatus Latescibacterota bacterium]